MGTTLLLIRDANRIAVVILVRNVALPSVFIISMMEGILPIPLSLASSYLEIIWMESATPTHNKMGAMVLLIISRYPPVSCMMAIVNRSVAHTIIIGNSIPHI